MNYAWLGNDFALHSGHGHMHLVPRYKETRNFSGISFEDGRWGKNYVPYTNEERPKEVAVKVRDAIRAEIPGALI